MRLLLIGRVSSAFVVATVVMLVLDARAVFRLLWHHFANLGLHEARETTGRGWIAFRAKRCSCPMHHERIRSRLSLLVIHHVVYL